MSIILPRALNALGELAAAREAYVYAAGLAVRIPGGSIQLASAIISGTELHFVDEQWRGTLRWNDVVFDPGAEFNWTLVAIQAATALKYAHHGMADETMQVLAILVPTLDRIPGWMQGYAMPVCEAGGALWLLRRTEHLDVLERNLREKVLAPDFRFPLEDARLAMAELCALQERYAEAVEWFDEARAARMDLRLDGKTAICCG